MPKAKAKPVWEDSSIEWFFASSSPTYPASAGSIPNESRIDRGPDADEVRACYHAILKALDDFEKPHRWSERYKTLGFTNSIARNALARDPSFYSVHNRAFWPSRIGYKVNKPQLMSHFFGISVAHCFAETDQPFPGGMVASPQVRQIIYELQPGYAKFFPVQIQFKDQMVDGYSWIIQPIHVFAECHVSDGKGGVYLLDKGDYKWDKGFNLKAGTENPVVLMSRSKLSNIHWTQEENLKHIWSAEVVRRLAPLILSREKSRLTGLIPIKAIED
jgi:hypothetical protein